MIFDLKFIPMTFRDIKKSVEISCKVDTEFKYQLSVMVHQKVKCEIQAMNVEYLASVFLRRKILEYCL